MTIRTMLACCLAAVLLGPATGLASDPAPAQAVPGYTGKVIEAMDAGSYTYVHVDSGKEKIWAAAPKVTVKVGDKVFVYTGMPMANFYSASLNRTFELIYFVPGLTPPGAVDPKAEVAKAHRASPPADVDVSGIKKATGGKTVAEVFENKKTLVGREVLLRGKVVKFAPGILDTNWIHLRDGTGTEGTNDLVCTTDATVAVGDTVLVRGVVSTDRDFGFGYKYDLIVENAIVTVE